MKMLNWLLRKRIWVSALCSFVVFILISFMLLGLVNTIYDRERADTHEQLRGISVRTSDSVQIFFDGQANILREIGVGLMQFDDSTGDEAKTYLNQASARWANTFHLLALEKDGRYYSKDGEFAGFDSPEFYPSANNNYQVSNVASSFIDKQDAIFIKVPLQATDGSSYGFFTGTIHTQNLLDAFSSYNFDGLQCYHLVDSKGLQMVGTPEGHRTGFTSNYFDNLKNLEYLDTKTATRVQQQISKNSDGYFEYLEEGTPKLAHYTPVGMGNWYLFTVTNKDYLDNLAQGSITITIKFAAGVLGLTALTFAIFMYFQVRARKDARINDDGFRLIAQHIGTAIVEWNYNTNKTKTYHSVEDLLLSGSSLDKDWNDIVGEDMIHPDDLEKHNKLLSDVMRFENTAPIQLRLKKESGEYHWYNHPSMVILDKKGKPCKVIGLFEDIDVQMRETETLKASAQRDLMTGLYNKVTTEDLIKCSLRDRRLSSSTCALFLIDIDNFKAVNDTLGHTAGDTAMLLIVEQLKKCFRTTDILGRVGGDEFVAFITDIKDYDWIEEKATEINTLLRLSHSEGLNTVETTASIGISTTANDSITLQELYANADKALYKSKGDGKSTYRIYM